jgi:uncharacterized protein
VAAHHDRASSVKRTGWAIVPREGGPTIRGDLHVASGTEPEGAVVLCHGFKGFKDWGFFPYLAERIAASGHAAVSFNFAHSGVGPDGVAFSALDLFARSTHSANVQDIHTVLNSLAEGEILRAAPRRIGLFGHSRGGGEAILAAAEAPRVQALVTWSAIASVERWSAEQVEAWRSGQTVHVLNTRTGEQMPMLPTFWQDVEQHREVLDIRRAAERVATPWLIVHGEQDESVQAADARLLHNAAGARAELLLVAEAGHTFGAVHPMEEVPPPLRIAADATCRWFDTFLR